MKLLPVFGSYMPRNARSSATAKMPSEDPTQSDVRRIDVAIGIRRALGEVNRRSPLDCRSMERR
jgi:hypothetical protein